MWVTSPYKYAIHPQRETSFSAQDAYGWGMYVMSNQRTIREQIECRDFETIALPQRICLGVAAFGGFALLLTIIYYAAIMK